MSNLAQGLQQNGFVSVKYPEGLQAVVNRCATSWIAASRLPEEIRRRFVFEKGAFDGGGWEIHNGEQGLDKKQTVHVPREHWVRLYDVALKVGSVEALTFLLDMESLFDAVRPTILNFLRELEVQAGLSGLCDAFLRLEGGLVLRFLDYAPGQEIDESLAKAHVDKGGITMYLWADELGVEHLRIADKEWCPFLIPPGEAVMTTALHLQLADDRFKALCHRVRVTPGSKERGRRSIVLFFPLSDLVFDKENFGRQQARPDGWTYGLKSNDLAPYFIDRRALI